MLLEASHLWSTRMCLLVPNQCWHCSLCYWVWLLSWNVTQRSIPSGWGHTAQAVALNLDKILHVSKAIHIPDVTKYFYPLSFLLCLAIFIFALEYFHQLLLFFFFACFEACGLEECVWLVFSGIWFWGFFDLQRSWSNSEQCCYGNTQLGTYWTVRNCLIDNIINDGSLKNLEKNT